MKRFNKLTPAALAATLIVSLLPGIPAAQAASTGIVIAEVYNGSADTQEWVTIANLGTTEIDLTNWALQDYSSSGAAQAKWYFPSGTSIKGKSLLVVEKSAGNSGSAAKGVDTITGGSFNFAGGSDRLDLINASNTLVDGVAWGTSNTTEGFSIAASSTSGTSFERKTATDTDKAADWQAVSSGSVQAYAWAPLPAQTSGVPSVTAVSPSENAANVAVTSDLEITFDKNFVIGSGNITVVNVSDSLTFATIDVTDAAKVTVDSANKKLKVTLDTLAQGKKYEVTLPEGAVQNASTGDLNGLKKWAFSTTSVSMTSLSGVRAAAPGTIVSVRGEVTAVFGANNAWIQDSTAGIRLYQGSGIGSLTAGQEVIVTGTLENYNEDLELNVSSVQTQSTNTITLPQPPVVAVNQVGAANEGSLVKVQNVWVKSDYTTGAGGIVVTDGTNDLVVYAQAGSALKTHLQGLTKSSANKFDITGISSVYNTTIELLPRAASDITVK